MEELLIQQFGVIPINQMLNEISDKTADYIAINRYCGGVLLYKHAKNRILCDYLDQRGFVATAYKDVESLKEDLKLSGYYFLVLDSLKYAIKLHDCQGKDDPLNTIHRRVTGLLDSVILRAENDPNKAYWAGQREALDNVTFILNEVRAGTV